MSTSTITGNLTKEPELRFTQGGQAQCTFTIADNQRYRDRAGEWTEKVSFVDVVCWRRQGENVSESLKKGDRVMVTGSLEQRSWENQDGSKGSKLQILADEVAPSLRWATAEITRNPRDDSGGARSAPAASQPQTTDAGGGFDEEPF